MKYQDTKPFISYYDFPQTTDKASASLRCCRPCARCPLAAEYPAPNPSAAAMVGVAGGTSVSSVLYQALSSTRNCVLMALAMPQMAQVCLPSDILFILLHLVQ